MNRPTRRRLLALALTTAVAALGAPAAAQAASCPSQPMSKPFLRFLDPLNYTLISNGGFESGSAGWSLTDAAVVPGNEPWKVRSATDARSLAIGASGRAVSPPFCVDFVMPTFRFFARRTSGLLGTLNVKLRVTTALGSIEQPVAVVPGLTKTWAPTSWIFLAQAIGIWTPLQTAQVQIVFEPAGGAWAVDDVYVDPFTRR